MPRGVRGSTNYAAQLQKLDEKIQKYTSLLSGLKSQRQELLAKKQETDMRDLYQYMQENKVSAAEIIAQLSPDSSIAASTPSSGGECV